MSFSRPSYVSPTTGSDHVAVPSARSMAAVMSASRTTPTLWVLVMAMGVVSMPLSRIHSSPVSSPLPFSRWQPAKKRLLERFAVGHDHGHARADRALADDQRPSPG